MKIWNLLQERDYTQALDEMRKWELPLARLLFDVGENWYAVDKMLVELALVTELCTRCPSIDMRPVVVVVVGAVSSALKRHLKRIEEFANVVSSFARIQRRIGVLKYYLHAWT